MMRRGFPVLIALGVLGILGILGLPASARAEVDAELHLQISRAIRRGRAFLLQSLAQRIKNPGTNYPMGRIALPLAAVLKAGASRNHPLVKDAFSKLRSLPLQKTYSVSCYLFALDALSKRSYEESFLGGGKTEVANSRRVKGRVRQAIVRAVRWLVEARAEGEGHWSYGPQPPGSGGHDFSNTQFAVLGLQIGLEHRVPIPVEVFEEVARRFLKTQTLEDPERVIRFRLSRPIDDVLARPEKRTAVKSREFAFQARPGGWGYRGKSSPYASMTAAGASSLLIARNGLKDNPRLRKEIDNALIRAYGWIGKHFQDYPQGNRHYYYTLYSLEKVGDLGDIESFEGKDWYAEGAAELVERQHENGSWSSYVKTSFALLFLTRATRLKPFVPRIFTNAGRNSRRNADYVYISRLRGFISAREALRFLAESRRQSLVPVGREIVRHYPPNHRSDLVAGLLALWTKNDQITRFAREALREITGLRSTKRDDFVLWARKYARIQELEDRSDMRAEDLVGLFRSTRNEVLKGHVVDLAHRRKLYDLAGELIRELSSASPAYRRKLHGVLVLWTGEEIRAPGDDDDPGWAATQERWQRWWENHRGRFARLVEARRNVRRLEKLTQAGILPRGGREEREVAGIVEKLIELGEPAIGPLRAAMQSSEFSYYLVEALEGITGEPVGLLLGL